VREALRTLERGAASNPTQLLSEGLRVAESAQAHNPFNPEAYQLFARLKYHEWTLWKKVDAKESRELEAIEGMMLQALENAVALRPLSSPLHDEVAQAHLFFRRRYLKMARDSD